MHKCTCSTIHKNQHSFSQGNKHNLKFSSNKLYYSCNATILNHPFLKKHLFLVFMYVCYKEGASTSTWIYLRKLGHGELHWVTNKSGRLAPPGAPRARMCALRCKLMRREPKADQKQTNSLDPIHIQQAPSQSTTLKNNDLDTRALNAAHGRERGACVPRQGWELWHAYWVWTVNYRPQQGSAGDERRLWMPPGVGCTCMDNYSYLLFLDTEESSQYS